MSTTVLTPSEQALLETTKLRAKAYVYVYEELAKAVGDKLAKEICSNVTYRLGTEIAKGFLKNAKGSVLGVMELGDALAKIPEHTLPNKKEIVQRKRDFVQIKMNRCPLFETWKEMGLAQKTLSLMCDISRRLDCGIIESLGHRVSYPALIALGAKECVMEITTVKR